MSPKTRLGDEERRLMHLVPAPAVRLMKRRVLSRPGVNSLMVLLFRTRAWWRTDRWKEETSHRSQVLQQQPCHTFTFILTGRTFLFYGLLNEKKVISYPLAHRHKTSLKKKRLRVGKKEAVNCRLKPRNQKVEIRNGSWGLTVSSNFF